MKVAVTYDEEEMIFQHFGHTERFKLYDIENGEIVSSEVVDTAGTGHEALAEFLAKRGVQTLICGGIGAGAVQALGMAGIQVYGGTTRWRPCCAASWPTTPTPTATTTRKKATSAATAKAATAAATEQKLPPVPRTGGFLREFLPQAPCLFGRSNVII